MKILLIGCLLSVINLSSMHHHHPVPIRPLRPSLEQQHNDLEGRNFQNNEEDNAEPGNNNQASASKCSCLSKCSNDTKIIIALLTGLVTALTTTFIAIAKYNNNN